MRKIHNDALEILARHTYNEIRTFYDKPENRKKFKTWKKKQNNVMK